MPKSLVAVGLKAYEVEKSYGWFAVVVAALSCGEEKLKPIL